MNILGHVSGEVIKIDTKNIVLDEGAIVEIIPLHKDMDENGVDEFCGKWEDDRSAEEIVSSIKNSRVNSSNNTPPL